MCESFGKLDRISAPAGVRDHFIRSKITDFAVKKMEKGDIHRLEKGTPGKPSEEFG
jgi:hypothetical protein